MLLRIVLAKLSVTAALAGTGVAEKRPEPELNLSIGSGFIASPRPYIGAHPRFFAVPVVNLEYGRWFWEGIRGGYALVQNDRLGARAFTQVRFRGLEPDSSAFLEGMEVRKRSLDAGFEVIYRGRPVGFRASALSDVLDRSNGQEVSFAAITGAPLGKTLVLVGFGPRWLSQDRVDYYYGVRESEARPDRPAYVGTATLNWDLTVSAIYTPNPRWTVFALMTREGLGSAIRSSPLVERSSAVSLVASVTYNF